MNHRECVRRRPNRYTSVAGGRPGPSSAHGVGNLSITSSALPCPSLSLSCTPPVAARIIHVLRHSLCSSVLVPSASDAATKVGRPLLRCSPSAGWSRPSLLVAVGQGSLAPSSSRFLLILYYHQASAPLFAELLLLLIAIPHILSLSPTEEDCHQHISRLKHLQPLCT